MLHVIFNTFSEVILKTFTIIVEYLQDKDKDKKDDKKDDKRSDDKKSDDKKKDDDEKSVRINIQCLRIHMVLTSTGKWERIPS